MQGGETFNESIAKHPRVFDRLFVSMVKAGEAGRLACGNSRPSGRIPGSERAPAQESEVGHDLPGHRDLHRFRDHDIPHRQGRADLRRNLQGFRRQTARADAIPDRRQRFRARRMVLPDRWFGGTIFGIRIFLRSTRGKQLRDRWKLKLPVFGPLDAKDRDVAFSRTFAQLIRSGVPILEVLEIVGGSSGNHVVEESIKGVSVDVEKGDNLSVALSKKPIFPPMMLRMVAAGEATGKIDTMLEKMADFWDEEIEAMLDALTSLIEPLLIVFLGVIVGGIVIAMFLPIFKLNEVVSQSKS